MNSDETLEILQGKERQDVDSLIVKWQRQILESLGVEQVCDNARVTFFYYSLLLLYMDSIEVLRSHRTNTLQMCEGIGLLRIATWSHGQILG